LESLIAELLRNRFEPVGSCLDIGPDVRLIAIGVAEPPQSVGGAGKSLGERALSVIKPSPGEPTPHAHELLRFASNVGGGRRLRRALRRGCGSPAGSAARR